MYRRSISFRVICLCLAVVHLTTQTAPAAVVPFDIDRGIVVLDVVINNNVTGRFGLDTGADRLYVDRSFAIEHDLLRDEAPTRGVVVSVDGKSKSQVITLRSLKIGDDPTMPNVSVTLLDMDSLGGGRKPQTPDGLLGYDFLHNFYVTVDYPAGKIELRSDAPHYLDGRAYHTVPFTLLGHLIMVDVRLPNGLVRKMALDYCSSHTLISTTLAAELGLPQTRGAKTSLGEINIGDAFSARNVVAEVAVLGMYGRGTPQSEIAGILGGNVLKLLAVTIDYHKRCLYVPYR